MGQSLPEIELTLRTAAMVQLIFMGWKLTTEKILPDIRLTLAAFLYALFATTLLPIVIENRILFEIVSSGPSLTTALLPILAWKLFENRTLPAWKVYWILLVHPGITYPWLRIFYRDGNQLFAILPTLVAGGAFALLAVFIAAREYSVDLLDERRASRIRFILIIASGVLLQLLMRAAFPGGGGVAGLLEPFLVYTVALYISVVSFALKPGILPARLAPAHERQATLEADRQIVEKLKMAMEKEFLYRQEGLTIRSLANSIEVLEYKLRKTIRSMGYERFSDYINEYRVEEAGRRLREEKDMAIVRIALECGFSSGGAFHRVFREMRHTTPGEFRKTR